MPLRIDHANLVVADLPAAVGFYRDRLGFQIVLEGELAGDWIATVVGAPAARMDCVILEAPGGGARLELLAYREPPPVALPGHGVGWALGLRHLAFMVDDLDATVGRLRAAGVALLSEPVTVPFPVAGRRKRLVYLHDPEGVLLELAEYRAEEGTTMTQHALAVPDMMCAHCANAIRKALEAVAGVEDVVIDVAGKRVTVSGGDAEAVLQAIREAGYRPEPTRP